MMMVTSNILFPQFKNEKMEQDSYNLLVHKREETIVGLNSGVLPLSIWWYSLLLKKIFRIPTWKVCFIF